MTIKNRNIENTMIAIGNTPVYGYCFSSSRALSRDEVSTKMGDLTTSYTVNPHVSNVLSIGFDAVNAHEIAHAQAALESGLDVAVIDPIAYYHNTLPLIYSNPNMSWVRYPGLSMNSRSTYTHNAPGLTLNMSEDNVVSETPTGLWFEQPVNPSISAWVFPEQDYSVSAVVNSGATMTFNDVTITANGNDWDDVEVELHGRIAPGTYRRPLSFTGITSISRLQLTFGAEDQRAFHPGLGIYRGFVESVDVGVTPLHNAEPFTPTTVTIREKHVARGVRTP